MIRVGRRVGIGLAGLTGQSMPSHQSELVCQVRIIGRDHAPFDGGHVVAVIEREGGSEPKGPHLLRAVPGAVCLTTVF